MKTLKVKSGFIDVTGGKVWYKILGEGDYTPLIILHGGPGSTHNYLRPLEDLAKNRQVIFYDQLGCGKSQRHSEKNLWTVDRYATELSEIIKNLKLQNYHLLGHSWGSALALVFAHENPKGLKSLILADPYIDTPRWEKDANELINNLPHDMQNRLKSNLTKSKEFNKASNEYYKRFVYGFKRAPWGFRKYRGLTNHKVYEYMWGPKEFKITGTLKDFDASKNLLNITAPVLFICGKNDEATPQAVNYYSSLTKNSKLKVFENSAHLPFWTEKKLFITEINNFLNSVN